MAHGHGHSHIQRWISLGLAAAAFAASFSLFSEAQAASGDGLSNLTIFSPGLAVAGLLALAGGALWLASRGEDRLW